jgi:hypothetical protein
MLSVIRSVSRVETSISRGSTDEAAGINNTSSKVKPTGKTSCSNTLHLHAQLTEFRKTLVSGSLLKKNPDLGLGFEMIALDAVQT